MRDPFYQQIREALGNEDLHPGLFEACAVDLLRNVYPGLVPVRGGSDSGFDGAVADGQGEVFPLVCTTEQDVIGNLTKSLDSCIAHGGTRRTVVLATSQALTPQRRQNLLTRARDKGFQLVQIHDREDFAQRLYRNARWSKDLLGLSGAPAALSLVPLSRRPLLDLDPIGREQDIEWLLGTEGDRVLTGEPGSGKTFLLRHLMLQRVWPGLFLCSSDETEIANALRAQQPGLVVVVDDAHVNPDRLVRLRWLRTEIKAGFSILATTWNGGVDSVIDALEVPKQKVHKLELLTRNQIVELYRQSGVQEEDQLLRSLVDQASNKPGLAATIAHLWLLGGWQEVLDGTALTRNVLHLFRDLVGNDCAPLLAAFSLGGEQGMTVETVADYLGIGRGDLQRQVTALAAGGVLFELEGRRGVLRVRPFQLRSALLRKVFFTSPVTLDYRPLLAQAPNLPSAVETLALARTDGADIPDQELRDLVQQSGAPDAWTVLAGTSEQNASWALFHYPGDELDLARIALRWAPREVLPRLLSRAETVTRPLHSEPDHPLRIVSDWLRDADAGEDEVLARRRQAVRSAKRYLRDGGRQDIGIHLIFLCLAPGLEGNSLDPGLGNVVTFRSRLLSDSSLRGLEHLWQDVRQEVRHLDANSWPHVETALWDWVDPETAALGEVPPETAALMQRIAAQVLADLGPLATGKPGIASRLQELAEHMDLDLEPTLEMDSAFELLFPKIASPQEALSPPPGTAQELTRLAGDWLRKPREEISSRLHRYEAEAKATNRLWPRRTPDLCREMARLTESPDEWLETIRTAQLPEDLQMPFLTEIVQRRQPGWEAQLQAHLAHPMFGGAAAAIILGTGNPAPSLVPAAAERLVNEPRRVEILCLRGEASLEGLKALLTHQNEQLALAAASGEWRSHPPKQVRPEIAAEWRTAILRANPERERKVRSLEYSLGDILQSDPELAFEWLRRRFQEDQIPPFRDWKLAAKGPFRIALAVLHKEQRIVLLNELKPVRNLGSLLEFLIVHDVDLYERLLRREDLRSLHLYPLRGFPEGAWIALAVSAHQAGYEPQEIARIALQANPSWGGAESRYWSRWDQAFAKLGEDSNEVLREIGAAGRRTVARPLQTAEENEKREAREGL